MRHKVSKQGRHELLEAIRPEYAQASWETKQALLDSFVAATGYIRKYAIQIFGNARQVSKPKGERKRRYDEAAKDALKMLWLASNRLCSKRLIPFLPKLMESMEKHGHLSLSEEIKEKLLSLSPATADRLLSEERKRYGRGKSTTKPGRLLKRHIPVRTFADWNEAEPGFLEADSVAHCGEVAKGQFLSTLTMTDIETGWTELAALANKTDSEVGAALSAVVRLLPFPIKGLDTDNGSEFINESVVDWCAKGNVTFTRSREYKKNDQAHVEEKNGSIVRRLVGYDRFQGTATLQIMRQLYAVARLFVNYFQPSMKLLAKQRDGGRVTRRYDKAQTPCQRILQSPKVTLDIKARVQSEFERLDPVRLLADMERLQVELWQTAATPNPELIACESLMHLFGQKGADTSAVAAGVEEHRRQLKKRNRLAKLTRKPDATPQGESVAEAMRSYVRQLRPGASFRVKALVHLGTRTAVDQALNQLQQEKVIVRTGWGQYAVPLISKPKTVQTPKKNAVNQ